MGLARPFLASRAIVPLTGVAQGVVIAGLGVGSFLVAFCLILSRPFRFLQGDAGVALGLALMLSIALRAWGATYDFTLGASGAWLGWVFIGIVVWLLWGLRPAFHEPGGRGAQSPARPRKRQGSAAQGTARPTSRFIVPMGAEIGGQATHEVDSEGQSSWGEAFGPVLSLFANLTVVISGPFQSGGGGSLDGL